MAHNSKRFVEVSLPGEPTRLKRSRHRTREDRVAPLHLRRAEVGSHLVRRGRPKRYEWAGCPDCVAMVEAAEWFRPRFECDPCREKSDIQYGLWTWNVPKAYRSALTRQGRAADRSVTRRLVRAFNEGVDVEEVPFPLRYDFARRYLDAGWHYF